MKKVLSLALAVMLLCTMALPASATESSTTLTLEYETSLNPSYTLSIPASTTISNANGFNNIGMIGITESQDLYGYHIDVSCTISDFIGEETSTHVMAFLSYQLNGADSLSGSTTSQNGTPTVLSFYEVKEDGTIDSVAVDASHTTVDSLHVGVYMDGNNAPSDTYTSVVTFSSALALNAQ